MLRGSNYLLLLALAKRAAAGLIANRASRGVSLSPFAVVVSTHLVFGRFGNFGVERSIVSLVASCEHREDYCHDKREK